MPALDPKVQEIAKRLADLYADRESATDHAHRPEIQKLWYWLRDLTKDSDVDELLYVVQTVDNSHGQNSMDLLKRAVPMCSSLEQIRTIIPHLRKNWDHERAVLLRKIVELIDKKDELLDFLTEVGYI